MLGLQSIKRHTKSRKWDGHEIVYGAEEATGNEDAYLDAYRNHTDSTGEFFASQGQVGRLLEFVIDHPDISKGEKWSQLCGFLGMSDSLTMIIRQLDFPHTNAAPSVQNDTGLRHVMGKIKFLMEGLVKVLMGWVGFVDCCWIMKCLWTIDCYFLFRLKLKSSLSPYTKSRLK
jgi:hypothetical protein